MNEPMTPETHVGERLAVVESQIRDFRDWQRETDRTLTTVKDSLNRIEAQMVSRAVFDGVNDKLTKLANDLDVKSQVEQALDSRKLTGNSVRNSIFITAISAIAILVSLVALLPKVFGA